MDRTDTFGRQYQALELEFRGRAEDEGDVYVPIIRPTSQVDFVFIGMEPSLGRWAKPMEHGNRKQAAKRKIELGFKDFAFSVGDFVLHYCIRKYLCCNGSTYYITNLSKGAMLVEKARVKPSKRYQMWYPLLLAELRLVSKNIVTVIAIGGKVEEFLRGRDFPYPLESIMHFSGQAARYRDDFIGEGIEKCGFQKSFLGTTDIAEFLEVAEGVMNDAQMSEELKQDARKRLRKYKELTLSQQKLVFGYKLAFERIGSR